MCARVCMWSHGKKKLCILLVLKYIMFSIDPSITSSKLFIGNSSPTSKPAPMPKCGVRHQKRISRGRILGGTSAMPGSHPWMAALYIGEEFCAGSLVAACWVVSAAHCFIRK